MKALVYHLSTPRWMLCKAAGLLSRRAYVGPLSGLRLEDRPIPALPGPSWVRLRVRLGGVCGTDLALILQRAHPATILRNFADFPAVLGHENVAVIDALGEAVEGWRIGQRVCVEPALGCLGRGEPLPCGRCATGQTSLCEKPPADGYPARAIIGLNARTGGSWSESFVAHVSQLHAVPDELADDAAVLIDPVASAIHAVLRRPPRNGETILVNGSGIIALGIVAAVRALGYDNPVTVIMRHEFQASLARRFGATDVVLHSKKSSRPRIYDEVARRVGGKRLDGRFGSMGLLGGYDLTYDCTGSGRGLTDAMMWTRSRGAVVAVGTSGITLLDTTPLWLDELEVIGANGRQIENVSGRSRHTYDMVFDWVREGRLDLSAIPVHRYPLADYRSALMHLLGRSRHPIVKAAFDPA